MTAATPQEIADAVAPKSDQLNADDLSGGRNLDVQIIATTAYRDDKGRTRIACRLEGFARVYRPCLTMVRLMVACWGTDSRAWIGRWIRLHTDPGVMFGGQRVGGLRISHASHLDRPVVVPLSETRGRRREWTVHPLTAPVAAAPRDLIDVLADVGLAIDEVDAWLASRDRPPVAALDAGQREQLADYLAGGNGRIEAVRAASVQRDQTPMSAEEIAAIEADEAKGAGR